MLYKDIIGEISYYCDFLTKHRLKQINKSSYQFIKITYIPRKYIDDFEVTDEILKNYLDIKFLDIRFGIGSGRKITDDGIKHMNLHTLVASGLSCEITDKGLQYMNLHILDATGNIDITDTGIKHMKNLSILYSYRNHRIRKIFGITHYTDYGWFLKYQNYLKTTKST